MKIRICTTFLLILLVFSKLNSQNLILNGDFEKINTCLEYNEKCSPVAWRSTSEKMFGYQVEGENKYLKLLLFKDGKSNQRKFAQTELLCPLEKGQIYTGTLKVKANLFGINLICVAFTETFIFDKNLDFQKVYSNKECINISSSTIKDQWVEIQFTYEAQGFEKFMCIGNFISDKEIEYTILDKKEFKQHKKSYNPQGLIEYGIDDIVLIAENGIVCEDLEARKRSIIAKTHRHTKNWKSYQKPIEELINEDFTKEKMLHQKNELPQEVIPSSKKNEIVLNDLNFDNNQYELRNAHILELDPLINEMASNESLRIEIVGHTDSKGSASYNLDLSLKRAKSIRAYLVKKGIDIYRMEVIGKGQSEPLFDAKDQASQRLNRRVVIEIL